MKHGLQNKRRKGEFRGLELLVLYLGMAVLGYFTGVGLKKKNVEMGWIGKVTTIAVVALVFVMGSRIGSDERVIANLDSIGLIAFAIVAASFAGSVLFVFLARKLMGIDKRGIRNSD